MCFGTKTETKTVTPDAPAETLNQAAPVKKSTTDTSSSVASGTKKYRTSTTGSALSIGGSPTGIPLST
jgi:type IV secretory pathway TrbL component